MITALLFLLIVFIQLWENHNKRAIRLKNNDYRDIDKRPEMWVYVLACISLGCFSLFLMHEPWYYSILLALLTRLAWFNVPFNLLTRGWSEWDYENPKGTSWWDKVGIKSGIPYGIRFTVCMTLWILTIIFLS